jgi:hypothetical protein
LNHLSIEVLGLPIIEEQTFSDWAWNLFGNLPQQLPIRYGNGHLAEEFHTKNMVYEAGGARAVGVRLEEALPGLYWLNYFGGPYLKLIGEDRLLSAPAFAARQVGNGVLIALDSSPLNWQSAAYREREEATINHLGRDYFFLKAEPGRQLVAPVFRAG